MSQICHYLLKTRSRSQFWKIWLLLLLISFSAKSAFSSEISINQQTYEIEIASNAEQRRLGLMHRKSLGQNQGLLLVYPASGNHKIWMKNMLIPLTLIWINDDFAVVQVTQVKPCVKNPCKIYSSPHASRFVLELSADQHPVKVGDIVLGLQKLR